MEEKKEPKEKLKEIISGEFECLAFSEDEEKIVAQVEIKKVKEMKVDKEILRKLAGLVLTDLGFDRLYQFEDDPEIMAEFEQKLKGFMIEFLLDEIYEGKRFLPQCEEDLETEPLREKDIDILRDFFRGDAMDMIIERREEIFAEVEERMIQREAKLREFGSPLPDSV